MTCSTPVVFIIFRRPDLAAQVFEAIRQAKPEKLLIIADGPRNETEASLCQQTREIVERVDWDCEVLRNYSDVNLGCRKRVSSGIDWAFTQVEEAIILEDDCLPHPDFFRFCSSLLERYRDDQRVWSICGLNCQDGNWRGDGSYYFSRYPDPWGWATWRRAWKNYDVDLSDWSEFSKLDAMNLIFENSTEIELWNHNLNLINEGIEAWDFQWFYCCWKNNGLSIWPNCNLVSNLGFREDGTFCKEEGRWSNLDTKGIDKIIHPLFMLRDKEADTYYFLHRQNGLEIIKQNSLSHKLKVRFSDLKRRLIQRVRNFGK
jgi:hypothetical protein